MWAGSDNQSERAGDAASGEATHMDHIDHILVVDDDHGIRTGVVDYLRKNGLRATAAVDGRDMLAQLDASAFDLVVLDIMMPGKMASRSAATCAAASIARCPYFC